MNFPSKVVENAVEHLSRLPGIGKRTALRLVLHLLKQDKTIVQGFGNALIKLTNTINYCSSCFSIAESQICEICANTNRDKTIICVVEDPMDILAIDNSGIYNGQFHVLHGVISPNQGIGPDDLKIEELMTRISQNHEIINEIILATNPNLEGEATAMYISKLVEPYKLKITRLARGLPSGGDIEYADGVTISKAIEYRQEMEY